MLELSAQTLDRDDAGGGGGAVVVRGVDLNEAMGAVRLVLGQLESVPHLALV